MLFGPHLQDEFDVTVVGLCHLVPSGLHLYPLFFFVLILHNRMKHNTIPFFSSNQRHRNPLYLAVGTAIDEDR